MFVRYTRTVFMIISPALPCCGKLLVLQHCIHYLCIQFSFISAKYINGIHQVLIISIELKRRNYARGCPILIFTVNTEIFTRSLYLSRFNQQFPSRFVLIALTYGNFYLFQRRFPHSVRKRVEFPL